jgi:hypothetical protein
MSVEEVLVAILGREGKPVGGGFLTGKDAVLTCAHVVNAAVGRSLHATGRPSDEVQVRLPGASVPVKAVIDPAPDAWKDPPASQEGGGDLCILKLPAGSADGPSTRLRIYANAAGRPYRTAGFPQNWQGELDISTGDILGRDQFGLLLLRPRGTADPKKSILDGGQRPAGVIYTGFSGSPVENGEVIVGIVTESRQPSDVTAYMIPVSMFPDRFKPQSQEDRNQVLESYPHVRALESRLAEQRLTGRVADTFDLRLRLCESFHDALEAYRTSDEEGQLEYQNGRDLRALEVALMLRARKDGSSRELRNLLLHAPGGGGKSSFLAELVLSAADSDLVPFYLDFSKSSEIESDTADARSQLKEWFNQLEAFGDVDALLDLAKPSGNLRPLLVIDSFNQATRQWREALETITRLSNQALAGASIIVADRMADRGPAMNVFRQAIIPPLAPSAYREVLGGGAFGTIRDDPEWSAILASPMFLNLLLLASTDGSESPIRVPGRMQILIRYFRKTCGFTSADLKLVADFAYEVYQRRQQTAIPKEDLKAFYEGAGAPIKQRVEDKGLIHDLGQDSEFRHQILHDALAALKVASATEREEEILLRAPAFEIVSLGTASQDAIELAVEALQYPEDLLAKRLRPLEAREFLAAVFDWNYWITLQCVASFDRRGVSPLPRWFRHAIYAHNLGRRFDPFLHTAVRAEQLRLLIPNSPDLTYFDATTRADFDNAVSQAIRGVAEADEGEENYKNEWLEVYLWSRQWNAAALEPLWGDPLLSWTAANGIRRSDIPEDITDDLIRIYRISRNTSDSAPKAAMFRWRIAHALGKCHPKALDALAGICFDQFEDPSVRYGAIRSLIELAATRSSAEDRRMVLERIRSEIPNLFHADGLRGLGNVRRELRRCCAFNEPHVQGREGWREEWLAEGLKQFGTILQEGATQASKAGLVRESEVWEAWVLAAESARTDDGDWNDRKSKWQQPLEEDQ